MEIEVGKKECECGAAIFEILLLGMRNRFRCPVCKREFDEWTEVKSYDDALRDWTDYKKQEELSL